MYAAYMTARRPSLRKNPSGHVGVRLDQARVLVVEDDWLIAQMNVVLLQEVGATASAAASRAAARALLTEHRFDVAVFDRQLRDGLSYDVAIEAQISGTAIIISSGTELRDLPSELECAILLPKPFDGDKLIDAVARALDWPRRA